MGQRSQIYIRTKDKRGNKNLVALYFQWNYGTYMISRARHLIEYIKNNEYVLYDIPYLKKVAETNFDIKSIVGSQDIIKEQIKWGTKEEELNDHIFEGQANNDGKLYIDVEEEKIDDFHSKMNVKYCFTDYSNEYLGNGTEYLKFDFDMADWEQNEYVEKEYIEITKDNLKWLEENAELMNIDELNNIIQDDYSKIYQDEKNRYTINIGYFLRNNRDILKNITEEIEKEDKIKEEL